ncbi:ABC transporter ATP-binding protein [Arthrobacter ginkgonis]|uniref:ABC transporter ATP-binding protein n=1 Tax=Arthrobacter ginkgonis TaxID=1630594 RepID=A0ABP7D7W5_9MICC
MTPALSLTDVVLDYPDGEGTLRALDRVDLDVDAGRILSLAGPSGSGKSSLLAVAAALTRPTSGRVAVGGTDVAELAPRERARLRLERIGIVFQQPNLLGSLTAVEQLQIAAHLRGASPAASRARALELLEVVGLAESSHRRPHQLSGGQRQRVNIARALMGSPQVLLVDEPTAALDHERSAAIVALLARATRDFGLATVMVTHDTEYIPLTDAVATMHGGRLAPAVPAGASASA